jgi:hypothetical protein
MAIVLPNGRNYFATATGTPAVGYKVYTYISGTSTPKATYTTSAASVANSNPVVLDSRGEAAIYWVGDYDVVLKDASDVTIWGPERLNQPETSGAAATLDAALRADLANFTDAAKGDALLGVKLPLTGTIERTQHDKNSESVNLFDFIATTEHAAILNYTSTFDCKTALQAALDTQRTVFIPPGLYLIGSTVTVAYQGARVVGSGFGPKGTRIKRKTNTSFGALISQIAGGECICLESLKFEDFSGLSDTNTSPLVSIASGNDWQIIGCWFLNGYRGLECLQGVSNGQIASNVFEAARKQAIYCYSAPLIRIVGNAFWKNTADFSTPADRAATISLFKDAVYTFGSSDVAIVGNYFLEGVYGHFIEADNLDGLTITGNYFTIPSQVDSGQRDDINLKNATRVTITGNTSNSILNSYIPGSRGARYCVNIDTGCSQVVISSNAMQAGVSGTINDPNFSAIVVGNPGVADAAARSTITYSASMTPDLTTGAYFFDITATNNTAFTINAPTGAAKNQRLAIRIRNTSGGALGAVTWNAVFKMAAWTSPATANSRTIEFEYNGTNWVEMNRNTADVPN